uniref:Large ribosomal subunit protein mL45 n=1 Tax=Phallusia mammillata TaxID=59560 RepID=A0A6F9DKL0_9ASCI|nr:39S ribosomal protein L45, mitochondrial-like [Phallusia mammillata]
MEVLRTTILRSLRPGKLNTGFLYGCLKVCHSSTWNPPNSDSQAGTKEYAKRHRQYAQMNYQEWRFPQKQRAIDISSTPQIFHPYKIEETGVKSKLSNPKKTLSDTRDKYLHRRTLKKRVPDFHEKRFPAEAQQIYIDAHNLLNSRRWNLRDKKETEEKLHNLVTTLAYKEMVQGLETKTVLWEWKETIEPPRVVQVVCSPMIDENNFYSQVTVKMHSKQSLAVYDRFGRLMFGDMNTPRSVLEYVVFERHISHPYGRWRIHGKIDGVGYEREPLQRTISFIRPAAQRSEADDWHKQEKEIHHFKWYPLREKRIAHTKRMERFRQGNKYWRLKRKRIVNEIKHTPRTHMRGVAKKMVRKKRRIVEQLREEGKLPHPPMGGPEPSI